ncbi:hypothetical protein BT96DRAFT_1021912 [Gymnopus androsaceus JB14]|uniref:Uncharacterized protein n=1 Tax=Gymnopus androsaceus JB14 TaxID=1447944 RepID=A0A6A4HBT9_9AGAR|nr:hypothetical protein BT96DRAFT_1021912 [Gymnopus androsaceus JB14]
MSAAPPPYNSKASEASGDAPPSYESLVDQVFELYDQKYKEDPEATTKALTRALGGKEADAAFVKEMSNLRLSISTLNTIFGNVEEGLAKFDAEKLPDESGKITEWQPKWKIIRALYTNTMLASRTLAGSIASRVKLFFESVLPKLKQESSITPQEKLEMLKYFLGEKVDATNYKAELKRDEDGAEQMAKNFEKIKTDVATFRAQFDVYFKGAENQLQKDVTDLQGKVKELETKLQGLTKSRNLAAGVAGTGAVIGIGAGVAMIATGVFAPVGIFIAVISALAFLGGGIAAAVLQSQIAGIQKDLDSAKADLNAKLAKQTRLETTLKPLVKSLDEDMITIGDKLQALKEIWSYIRSQAQEARLHVEEALKEGVPPMFNEDNINFSIESYKKLHICVKMYAEGFEGKSS